MGLVEYYLVYSSGLDQVWHEIQYHRVVASSSRTGGDVGGAQGRHGYSRYADTVAGGIHSRVVVLQSCLIHSSRSTKGRLGRQGIRQAGRVAEIQQYSSTTCGCNVGTQPQPDRRIEKRKKACSTTNDHFIIIATRKTRPVYLIWCRPFFDTKQ